MDKTRQSEEQIIALLLERDEAALDLIRQTYGRLCYALAYRLLGSREDAEECINDMLLAVWNSVPPLQPVSLEAYLVTLARRAAMDKFKSQQRLKRGGGQAALAIEELSEILPNGEYVESEIEQRELVRALKAFLDTLPPETRHIFMQRYFMAKPVQQIADENSMKQSAVKMSLLRTRNRLKEHLAKEGLL